ncbi:Uncharacterized protein pbN1_26080 [Aromatoleum bremense]|nr:Uncharacterized protein pbN1_26080 [Aromatoleum bremense]
MQYIENKALFCEIQEILRRGRGARQRAVMVFVEQVAAILCAG